MPIKRSSVYWRNADDRRKKNMRLKVMENKFLVGMIWQHLKCILIRKITELL